MAANKTSIELILSTDSKSSPLCPHGPTLLFERLDQSSGKPRTFYACSAFRDRKACNFFQWADQKVGTCAQSRSPETDPRCHSQMRKRYLKFQKLPRNERHVCCTCGLLLLDGELKDHESRGHEIKHRTGLKELKHPSFLFTPLDSNKTYAQYLFSKTTVDFLLGSMSSLGHTHILCVGTPRIHEEVQARNESGDTSLTSMLLDLDDRYAQLYPPTLFTKYNMFNHHFFEEEGLASLKQFLVSGGERVVLVTDPPFGGMVEALVATFVKLSHLWRDACHSKESTDDAGLQLPTVWFFPYFMESRILSQLPSMKMLDYKVDYDNHSLFNNQHKKKGSPVRIFTNINQALFTLPEEEGYWFCKPCLRYSSKENWHCKDCGACTSKDGTSYVHCDACMRCVKASRVHCFQCEMCQLKDHVCGQARSLGCHICGEQGHKRRECPQRIQGDSAHPHKNKSLLKRKLTGTRNKQKGKKFKL